MSIVNIYISTRENVHNWYKVLSGASPYTFTLPGNQYTFPNTHDWMFYYYEVANNDYGYENNGDLAAYQVFALEHTLTLTAPYESDASYSFMPVNVRVISYTITYLANGGTGTMTPSVVNYGDSFTFKNNDFAKAGYDFKEWRLNAANGNYIAEYSQGYIYGNWFIKSNCTATAEWTGNTYTIVYDANGGLGTMTPSTATYGSNFTFQRNSFTKNAFNFTGWWLYIGTTTTRVNDATTYSDQSTFFWDIDNTQRTITAKAQWKEIPPEEIRVTYLRDPPDVLYGFFKHTFSTCGAVGRKGPTLDLVKTAYSTVSWAQNTAYLSMETQGIQEWKVPATGSYTIECRGAQGTGKGDYFGGLGATIIGTFNLTQGEVLSIVIGQQGVNGEQEQGGGGGGGSFVYKKSGNVLCIVAGGGGGGGAAAGFGGGGSATQIPVNGGGSGNGGYQEIGYGGNGGGNSIGYANENWNDAAGGGGGWFSNGGNGVVISTPDILGYGGYGRSSGFIGGYNAQYSTNGRKDGGFGGGGGPGGNGHSGGGGGGYTGGGGGNNWSSYTYYGGGQGGGSYNNGTNQTNTGGVNRGHGSVIITNNTISGDYYNNNLTYSISSTTITSTFLDNNFTKTGYNFIGWHLYDGNTRINTNSIYSVGESFTWTLEKNIYYAVAQWVLKTSLIAYDANGGDGTLLGANPQTATYSVSFTFQPNNFTRTGYTFKEWHLYEGGNNLATYTAGQIYSNWDKIGTNYTAKAQWTANEYTITYNPNGGTGTVANSRVKYGSNFVFQNTNVNGFTVYAWCSHSYNSSTPSVGELYFAIGDTSSTFYSTYMSTNATYISGYFDSYMLIDCKNVLVGCMLLSKPNGREITILECQLLLLRLTFQLTTAVTLLNTFSLTSIYNTLQPSLNDYKNPDFYNYILDGSTSLNIATGGNSMYKSNGNTTSIVIDDNGTNLLYNTTTENSVTINSKTVNYISLGYSTSTSVDTRPLTMLAKSSSRIMLGFAKWSVHDITNYIRTNTTFDVYNGINIKRTGYNFSGWWLYDGDDRYDTTTYNAGHEMIWNIDKGLTAKAQWTAVKYSIKYNKNGGNGTMTDSTATYDNPFTFADNLFTRTGYKFSGWHLHEGDNRINTETYGPTPVSYSYGGTWNIDKDLTAKAQWTAKTYEITIDKGDGTGTISDKTSATYDSPFTFPSNTFLTKTGHTFSGWWLYKDNLRQGVNTTYNSEHAYGNWNLDGTTFSVLAQWTQSEFIVTFNTNGKGGAGGTGGTIIIKQNYNTTVTCPTIKAVGYVFGGWATSAANAESKIVDKLGGATFTLGTANQNFVAIWTENTNGTRFSELQTVLGGTDPIQISEYRTQSGQTTANSVIRLGTHLKGKSKPIPDTLPITTTVHNAGTNFNASAKNLVFGIKALQNIKIVGFDIKMYTILVTPVACSIDFYYRIGLVIDTNIQNSFTDYGWKKITSGTYTAHTDTLQYIPTDTFTLPFSLDINENDNVCIAISVISNNCNIAYKTPEGGWAGTMGQTSSTETNVFEVKAGFASYLPTTNIVTPNRVFQGNIRYQLRSWYL